jgi:Eukaryotic aspartyl protease
LRDISGPAGYLSLGGLPPVSISSDFISTPILITNIPGYPHAYDFYTINIDSILLHRDPLPNSGGPSYQYVVDSGSTQNVVPTSVANAINNAYIPPAVYDPSQGVAVVPCNAHAPSMGIVINGAKFDINPLDMLIDLGFTDANGTEVCETSVIDGGDDPANDIYVLSDVFLKNVVAVFDVGAGMMRFASREHYPSNDPIKM